MTRRAQNLNLPSILALDASSVVSIVPNTGVDVSAQVQAALDAASAAGERTGGVMRLVFPAGTYILNSTIVHPTNVIVEGVGRTTIFLQGSSAPSPLWRFVPAGTNAAISRTELRNCLLQGSGEAVIANRTGTGISMMSTLFTRIIEVEIWDFVIGIDLNDGTNNVFFSAYNTIGPMVEVNRCTTGIRAYANANNNRIVGTRVFFSYGATDNGIGIDIDNAAALSVEGCAIEACDTCMRVRNTGGYPANQELQLTVTGCYFEPGTNPDTLTVGSSYDIPLVEGDPTVSSDIAEVIFSANRYSGNLGTANIPAEGLHKFDGYLRPFFGARIDGAAAPKKNMVRNGQVLYFNSTIVPGWATAGAPTFVADTVNFVTGNRSLDVTATTALDQMGVSFLVSDESEWITFGFRYQILVGTDLIVLGQSGPDLVQYADPTPTPGTWQVGYVTIRRNQASNAAALSFSLRAIGARVLIDEIWAVGGRYATTSPEYGERIELLDAPLTLVSGSDTGNLAWGPIDITNLPAILGAPLNTFSTAPRGVVGCIVRMSIDVTGGAGVLAAQHRMYIDVPGVGAFIPASYAWLQAVYGAMEHTTDVTIRDTILTGGVNVGDGLAFDYNVELIAWVLS